MDIVVSPSQRTIRIGVKTYIFIRDGTEACDNCDAKTFALCCRIPCMASERKNNKSGYYKEIKAYNKRNPNRYKK